MDNVIPVTKVGIAELKTGKAPERLRTSGLGSCVGVVLYDELKGIAGMAHIMLPDSSMARKVDLNRAKYADTAIDDLVEEISKKGGSLYRMKAKIAGGAQMFAFSSASDLMRIGPKNIEAVKRKLIEKNISIESEDVGGKNGRTLEFDIVKLNLHIRKVNQGEYTI
ncbi:chemotaxis protein CheD [Halobacillus sp. BBL2006]|uniref:chemotaxis protein CheD n=1 Tax=Halobacillus sp. BBL2006 TaxID=1543706 RepID=UPI0005423975|nr:chemotaxis protein CheD [Halobacillus sp. BBL2006]KHE71279.1 chemotaxis protein CheD [Halobacillus sp. BBL2006]